MRKVAIIGYGTVGKAMQKVFPDALIYDENKEKSLATKEEVNECELALVCVPTPMKIEEGKEFFPADTSIVEEVISWLESKYIVIKSTVPPTFTDTIVAKTGKNVCFSPEIVGESKYFTSPWKYPDPSDPRLHDYVIIGGEKEVREKVCDIFVERLGPEKTYYLTTAVEAEIIKYMENCWGAVKVVFCQEFYDLCQKLGASYHVVREGWTLDKRVEKMHSAVFVNERGFGGKCFPKDTNALVSFADLIGISMDIIKAAIRKNRVLRKETT